MNVSFDPLDLDATAFVSERTGIDFSSGYPFPEHRWFCVTARDGDRIMGVILCEFINHFEALFNSAVADPRCATKRLLRAVYTALFSRVVRLTAFIDVDNRRAIRVSTRMGFVVEGLCRLGINGKKDALTFGMLRSDCKFLTGTVARPPVARTQRSVIHG
jgi:hypothetical protein